MELIEPTYNELLYYRFFNLIHGTFNLTVNAEKY